MADRYNRRIIMLVAQCLTVVASVVLAFGVHAVAGIYACLFLIAVTRTFQMPIRGAIAARTCAARGAFQRHHLERDHVRICQRWRTGAGGNLSCDHKQPRRLHCPGCLRRNRFSFALPE